MEFFPPRSLSRIRFYETLTPPLPHQKGSRPPVFTSFGLVSNNLELLFWLERNRNALTLKQNRHKQLLNLSTIRSPNSQECFRQDFVFEEISRRTGGQNPPGLH